MSENGTQSRLAAETSSKERGGKARAPNLGGDEAGRARKVRKRPLPLDRGGWSRAGFEHGVWRSFARPRSVRARGWTQVELRHALGVIRPHVGHRWGDRAQPKVAQLDLLHAVGVVRVEADEDILREKRSREAVS